MTVPALRPPAEVSAALHDPRDDWHDEARHLRDQLEAVYGPDDPLPTLAGGWVTRQKSRHTRTAYARQLQRWEQYARSTGVHPLKARLPLADAYASRLQKEPTLRRVKGGRRGEMNADGPPASDAAQAQALSACASFYTYCVAAGAVEANPFTTVRRPAIDPDFSPTDGMLPGETARLIDAARRWSLRSHALVCLLYLLGPRIDELLSLDAQQLGYDSGHRVFPLKRKGGGNQKVPVPPLALDALLRYLGERTEGPLFVTRTGRRWSQPEVWKHLHVLARHADIPQSSSIHPHTLRHNMITDALEAGIPLGVVQDAAGHTDPRTTQRYNRRRKGLDNHPAYRLASDLADRLTTPEEQ